MTYFELRCAKDSQSLAIFYLDIGKLANNMKHGRALRNPLIISDRQMQGHLTLDCQLKFKTPY